MLLEKLLLVGKPHGWGCQLLDFLAAMRLTTRKRKESAQWFELMLRFIKPVLRGPLLRSISKAYNEKPQKKKNQVHPLHFTQKQINNIHHITNNSSCLDPTHIMNTQNTNSRIFAFPQKSRKPNAETRKWAPMSSPVNPCSGEVHSWSNGLCCVDLPPTGSGGQGKEEALVVPQGNRERCQPPCRC